MVMKGNDATGLIAVCILAFLVGKAISYTASRSLQDPPQPPAVAAPRHAVPAPPSDSAETTYDSGIIAMGKEIFSRAEAVYSSQSTYFDVWGSGYPDAVAALFMPEKVWNGLSGDQRDALVALVQSEIPNIRNNPDRYIGFSKDTPLYHRLRMNVQNIGDGHYAVFTTVQGGGQWLRGKTVAEWKPGVTEL
jgi:hypothetical protein